MAAVTSAVAVSAGASIYSANKQASSAKKAAKTQAEAAIDAQESTERLSAPYRGLGESAIPQFNQFIEDPTGYTYLQNNPMFQAALDYTGRQIGSQAAAAGKLNSGGTVDALFQNYLATGNDLVNQGYNRLMSPIQLGQAAAAGQAATNQQLITDAGNARAAGTIGVGNAKAANVQNLADIASFGIGKQWGF